MSLGFTNVRWVFWQDGKELPQTAHEGEPILIIEGVGKTKRTAVITTEQKFFAAGMRAVYLGTLSDDPTSFEKDPETEYQDPRPGHEREIHKGVTDDPSIVQLTLEFCAACNAGTFSPQIIVGR